MKEVVLMNSIRKSQLTCLECFNGEHDNYDEDIILASVINPDDGKYWGRGYLCLEHRQALKDDGYRVTLI